MMTPLINVGGHYRAIRGAGADIIITEIEIFLDTHSTLATSLSRANGPRLLQQQDAIISSGHSDPMWSVHYHMEVDKYYLIQSQIHIHAIKYISEKMTFLGQKLFWSEPKLEFLACQFALVTFTVKTTCSRPRHILLTSHKRFDDHRRPANRFLDQLLVICAQIRQLHLSHSEQH